ncbi:permease-like cell division protein FtsX [Haloechinothrix sp. LS1_15]|uniref:permease-like cell division protein FtsX n=1 Tax=Haloechinothrix sp. LS1_15 TaxID=2652248 RepID=UPI0029484251|nr:permease-like cell division protein FtsX [Haloechinothrix sp. LS1_15]MDV6014570.1 ABC transporter permease [Haloechinothrix sp. LS1_15]
MRASFVFSEVATGLRRNVTMTIAMILTTAISLTMLGGGLLIMQTVDLTKDRYLDDIEVSIFLTDDVSANDENCTEQPCADLRRSLEENPEVETVVFQSREEAYESFQRIFEQQPELVELARPEALPASLRVRLVDPERADVITNEYEGEAGIHQIQDQGVFLERLIDGLNSFRNITLVGSVALLAAALLLIANMVQISAFTRRTEVGIMRLVGATRWYTQLPFLLEAVVAGVTGALLAVASLVGVQLFVVDGVLAEIRDAGIIAIPSLLYTVLIVAPVLLLSAVVISAVTGYVTLRMYVRH